MFIPQLNLRYQKFQSVPRADPILQLFLPKYRQERAGLPGVLTHLRAQVRLPLLLKFLAQDGPARSHQDTGTKEEVGTRSFQFPSMPQS